MHAAIGTRSFALTETTWPSSYGDDVARDTLVDGVIGAAVVDDINLGF